MTPNLSRIPSSPVSVIRLVTKHYWWIYVVKMLLYIFTRMQKEMAVCLSQWRAFKNHPCAQEHTSCIYMCGLPSPAQQLSVSALHFLSPVPPRALITKAVGAHLCESTGLGVKRTHLQGLSTHASSQTAFKTTAQKIKHQSRRMEKMT